MAARFAEGNVDVAFRARPPRSGAMACPSRPTLTLRFAASWINLPAPGRRRFGNGSSLRKV
eukprot:7108616-Pyramimonas_sp.AAC.1